MKSWVKIVLLGFGIWMLSPATSSAQCPMCKMAAESNMKNGGTAGKGLNKGILYMLLTPYVIIGTIGFVWYRNRRKANEPVIMVNDQKFSDN